MDEIAASGEGGLFAGSVYTVFIEGLIDFPFEKGKEEAFVRFYRPQAMAMLGSGSDVWVWSDYSLGLERYVELD